MNHPGPHGDAVGLTDELAQVGVPAVAAGGGGGGGGEAGEGGEAADRHGEVDAAPGDVFQGADV